METESLFRTVGSKDRTSLSLIDVMSHGRACGMLNPYDMPVPLTADRVDENMGPILAAVKTGILRVIRKAK